MKKIELKTGYVVCPENYEVLEETRTENSDFAAVITGAINGAQHYYLYLADSPVREYGFDEEEAMDIICSNHDDIAAAIYAEDGLHAYEIPNVESVEPNEEATSVGIIRGELKEENHEDDHDRT